MDIQNSFKLIVLLYFLGYPFCSASNDKKNCNQSLLIAHDGGIMRYDLANNQSTPFYNDIGAGRYIDADKNEGLVFFNDYFSDTLYRINYMGDREAIAISDKEVYGLSVDHVAKRVFYAVFYDIKSIGYDGNDERTHYEGSERIRSIMVDATSRKIYVSENRIGLYRCDIDDCVNKEVLTDNTHYIHGIIVNIMNNQLLWTELYSNRIVVSSADGSHQQELIRIYRPYGIALKQGHFYITQLENGTLVRMNTDGTNVRVLISGMRLVRQITSICFPTSEHTTTVTTRIVTTATTTLVDNTHPFVNQSDVVVDTDSGAKNKWIIVVGVSSFGLFATIVVIILIAYVMFRFRNGRARESPSTSKDTPAYPIPINNPRGTVQNPEMASNENQERPDYLTLINPLRHNLQYPGSEYMVSEETSDYLAPINTPRFPMQNPSMQEMSSEYLTPIGLQHPNDDDAPLYQAPVINREETGNSEYEQLNLYETIAL